MLKDVLPANIMRILERNFKERMINEVRIRIDKPIIIVCDKEMHYLQEDECVNAAKLVCGTADMIEEIVFRACEYSVYANNEQIKNGYIMLDDGMRIGICGVVVGDAGITTIKDFSSICIRVPHVVEGCSLPIFHLIYDGKVNNTIILSMPGAGKTTMIRDIIFQFTQQELPYNIFVADERGEIGGIKKLAGDRSDFICFLNKKLSIMYGLRSMAPEIIITDELGADDDYDAIEYAANCGVSVIATVHANDIEDVKNKPKLMSLLDKNIIKRLVFLSKRNGVGTIECVYNNNLIPIYGGVM